MSYSAVKTFGVKINQKIMVLQDLAFIITVSLSKLSLNEKQKSRKYQRSRKSRLIVTKGFNNYLLIISRAAI